MKNDAPKDAPHDATKPDRPARPEKTDEPAAPPVVEYPKTVYHADGRTLTVQNADEEAKAKKDGFEETPPAPAEPRTKRG